jgi:hypothetical protein
MVDPNMDIIYGWAEELGPLPEVPPSIKEPMDIAKFVDFIDKNIFASSKFWEFGVTEKKRFLTKIAQKTDNYLWDIKDGNQRINITLRLWASCLSAAKTMRRTYVTVKPDSSLYEELYTAQMREKTFKNHIDPLANKDGIYRLGVEAAPFFVKEVRGQKIFSDGIPSNSVVMKYMPKE